MAARCSPRATTDNSAPPLANDRHTRTRAPSTSNRTLYFSPSAVPAEAFVYVVHAEPL